MQRLGDMVVSQKMKYWRRRRRGSGGLIQMLDLSAALWNGSLGGIKADGEWPPRMRDQWYGLCVCCVVPDHDLLINLVITKQKWEGEREEGGQFREQGAYVSSPIR